MFDLRDLVAYHPHNSRDAADRVLGKVVDIVHDIDRSIVYIKITKEHRQYRKNYIYSFPLDDPRLSKRKRWGTPLKPIRQPPTHCPQKHEYSEQNTYIDPDGCRHCRICQRARNREYYRRKQNGRTQDQPQDR